MVTTALVSILQEKSAPYVPKIMEHMKKVVASSSNSNHDDEIILVRKLRCLIEREREREREREEKCGDACQTYTRGVT